jgi:hypothetical protein
LFIQELNLKGGVIMASKKDSVICRSGIVRSEDGKDKLYELVYWNAVQRCDSDNCGCIDLCSNPEDGKPCKIISSYMGNVYDLMVRTYKGVITEDVAYRIGMHLVPLYKILCRLKMQEFIETSVVWRNDKGDRKVNPIFEEMRKTISSIESIWKNLGYIVGEGKTKKDKFVGAFNQRNYYDIIESGGMPMLSQLNTPD